jgi:hypothetical protein
MQSARSRNGSVGNATGLLTDQVCVAIKFWDSILEVFASKPDQLRILLILLSTTRRVPQLHHERFLPNSFKKKRNIPVTGCGGL